MEPTTPPTPSRPSGTETRQREFVAGVRLTAEEMDRLRAAVAKSDQPSVSAFVRDLVLQAV